MLDVKMNFRKGILFVRLKGILTKDDAIIIDEKLTTLINANGIKYLLINLEEVEDVDKHGIKAIFSSYNSIINNNGKLMMCGIDKLFIYLGWFKDLYQVKDEYKAFSLVNI